MKDYIGTVTIPVKDYMELVKFKETIEKKGMVVHMGNFIYTTEEPVIELTKQIDNLNYQIEKLKKEKSEMLLIGDLKIMTWSQFKRKRKEVLRAQMMLETFGMRYY